MVCQDTWLASVHVLVQPRVLVLSTILVAITYFTQKTQHVFPIIGGRKIEQLQQNLEALDITLAPEQIKFSESQTEFDTGSR